MMMALVVTPPIHNNEDSITELATKSGQEVGGTVASDWSHILFGFFVAFCGYVLLTAILKFEPVLLLYSLIMAIYLPSWLINSVMKLWQLVCTFLDEYDFRQHGTIIYS